MKFVYLTTTLQFQEGASYPAVRPIKKVQVSDRTAGGKFQVENLGVTIRGRNLVFEDMLKTDHDNLKNFFDVVVNGMEKVFQFTDERGVTKDSRFTTPDFIFSEDDFELFSGSLPLEYV